MTTKASYVSEAPSLRRSHTDRRRAPPSSDPETRGLLGDSAFREASLSSVETAATPDVE